MKGLTKLALATAIVAASGAAFAMESMDDETLAGVTGQEGITVNLGLNFSGMKLLIEDDDGTSGNAAMGANTSFATAGGILMEGLGLNTNGNMAITVDAGGDTTGTGALLAVSIKNPNATSLILAASGSGDGFLKVVKTNGSGVYVPADAKNIMQFASGTSISIAANMQIDLQLGSELATGAFATLNADLGTVTVGVADGNASVQMFDGTTTSGGTIAMDNVILGGLNATGTKIDVDKTDGLVIRTGASLSAVSMTINNLAFGQATSASIGDIYITGLNLANQTINVKGH